MVWPLTVVAVMLAASNLLLQYLTFIAQVHFRGLASLEAMFSLDREANLPSWFSSILLLTIAALCWTIGGDVRARRERRGRHWQLLAVVLTVLSLDEMVSFHERLNDPLKARLGTSGALEWAWVLVAIPAVLVLALLYLPWLRNLPRGTRYGLVLAGCVYIGGALVLEMIGAYLFSHGGGLDYLPYQIVATCEESMEMAGLIIAIGVLSKHLTLIAPRESGTLRRVIRMDGHAPPTDSVRTINGGVDRDIDRDIEIGSRSIG